MFYIHLFTFRLRFCLKLLVVTNPRFDRTKVLADCILREKIFKGFSEEKFAQILESRHSSATSFALKTLAKGLEFPTKDQLFLLTTLRIKP